MNKYTIYCTSEQTKRANELGAPLEKASPEPWKNKIPTIEQMCGWLRDKYNIHIYALQCVDLTYMPQGNICNNGVINQLFDWGYEEYFDSYQQAMHVAIDTALKYLEKENKKWCTKCNCEAADNMRCKFPENFEPKYTIEQIREINNHK